MITQTVQVCKICNEGVTDPVCMNCYNKELLTWLRENIGNKEVIRYIMKRALRNAFFENLGEDSCILCGRESVFVCRYCHFSKIKRTLQEINISDESVDDFSEIFNYDIYYANDY